MARAALPAVTLRAMPPAAGFGIILGLPTGLRIPSDFCPLRRHVSRNNPPPTEHSFF